MLDHELRLAIGIGGREWVIFFKGQRLVIGIIYMSLYLYDRACVTYFRLAVDSGRRREDDLVHIELLHDVEEIESALLNMNMRGLVGGGTV